MFFLMMWRMILEISGRGGRPGRRDGRLFVGGKEIALHPLLLWTGGRQSLQREASSKGIRPGKGGGREGDLERRKREKIFHLPCGPWNHWNDWNGWDDDSRLDLKCLDVVMKQTRSHRARHREEKLLRKILRFETQNEGFDRIEQ